MVTVSAGARVHVGFQNLSLAHERLYGGIGVGLDSPRVRVRAEPASEVDAADGRLARHAARAVEELSVEGVRVDLEESFPHHVGLGSGTQLALAIYVATALAHGREPVPRNAAPALGRGGRSGVGVATFEAGGFVVDGGHPTEQFTSEPPVPGTWTVPPVVSRHDLPADWRFVLVRPAASPGRNGDAEDASIRRVVESAAPQVADEIAGVLTRRLLPAAATGRLAAFGTAISAIGRLNGAWYADAQGGVYRPPAGEIVAAMEAHPLVCGVGQSSWGPTVYCLTDAESAADVCGVASDLLADHSLGGSVTVVEPASDGVRIEAQ